MDKYEVPSRHNSLRNYVVPVRGTDVTCYIGVRHVAPDRWCYSLWDAQDELISFDTLDMTGATPTAEQIACIAYLCDVEYAVPA